MPRLGAALGLVGRRGSLLEGSEEFRRGDLLRRLPLGAYRVSRAGGLEGIPRGDAHEVAVPDHGDAGQGAPASCASTDTSVAPAAGARRTLPKSIPSRFTSEAYWWRPVTSSRPFTFGIDWPATVHWSAGVVDTSSPMALTSFWPLVREPKAPRRCVAFWSTWPSSRVRPLRSTFHSAAARSSSASRAAAATLRSWAAMIGVVRLPKVPMSKGVRSVSPMTRRIPPSGARSSSATTCVSSVRMFWPNSTLPVKTVMRPSSPMWSHAPMSLGGRGSCAGVSLGIRTTNSPLPRSCRKPRRSSSKR